MEKPIIHFLRSRKEDLSLLPAHPCRPKMIVPPGLPLLVIRLNRHHCRFFSAAANKGRRQLAFKSPSAAASLQRCLWEPALFNGSDECINLTYMPTSKEVILILVKELGPAGKFPPSVSSDLTHQSEHGLQASWEVVYMMMICQVSHKGKASNLG